MHLLMCLLYALATNDESVAAQRDITMSIHDASKIVILLGR